MENVWIWPRVNSIKGATTISRHVHVAIGEHIIHGSEVSDAIPNAMIAAIRPRSIAINELTDKFVLNSMEAPMEAPTNTMVEWVSSIKNS